MSGWQTGPIRQTPERLAGRRAAMGRIDILVNNAGITRDALALRMKERTGRRVWT